MTFDPRAQGQPSSLVLPCDSKPIILSSRDVAVCTQQVHNSSQMLSPHTTGPPPASAVGQEGSQSTARSSSGGEGTHTLPKVKSSMWRWGRGSREEDVGWGEEQCLPRSILVSSCILTQSTLPLPLPPLHGAMPFLQGPSPPRTWFPHPPGDQTLDPRKPHRPGALTALSKAPPQRAPSPPPARKATSAATRKADARFVKETVTRGWQGSITLGCRSPLSNRME